APTEGWTASETQIQFGRRSMVQQIKKFIFIALIGYIIYWLLAHHIILFGREPNILKKEELTFTHTFYNIKNEKELKYIGLEAVLVNEDLYYAGIGDLLVDQGWVTREELRKVERELY
ncbi:MAG: hypothetical protein ACLFRG_23215, partial [Desulfococcaceae bacterium]